MSGLYSMWVASKALVMAVLILEMSKEAIFAIPLDDLIHETPAFSMINSIPCS